MFVHCGAKTETVHNLICTIVEICADIFTISVPGHEISYGVAFTIHCALGEQSNIKCVKSWERGRTSSKAVSDGNEIL